MSADELEKDDNDIKSTIISNIISLMCRLELVQFNTFAFLMIHLRKICDNSANNKMTSKALAACFTPIMLHNRKYDFLNVSDQRELEAYQKENQRACGVVQFIIDHWNSMIEHELLVDYIAYLPI